MKIRIILKSFNAKIINLAITELKSLFLQYNYKIYHVISLPTKIKKFCVLRSPHIDKDSREHFELRLYKKFVDIDVKKHKYTKFTNNLLNFNISTGLNCLFKIL
jgi:small subunit ribosomal protein S10